MPVDRSFTLQGTGTVVTGTILSGEVAPGDILTVSPTGLKARVRSVRVQNRPAERGVAGDRCAQPCRTGSARKPSAATIVDPALHARPRVIVACASQHPKAGLSGNGCRCAFMRPAMSAPAVLSPMHRSPKPSSSSCLNGRSRQPRRPFRAAYERPATESFSICAPRRGGGVHRAAGNPRSACNCRSGRSLAALLDRPPFLMDGGVFARDRAPARFERWRPAISSCASDERAIVLSPANWLRFKRALHKHGNLPCTQPASCREDERLRLHSHAAGAAFAAACRACPGRPLALDGAWIKLAGHERMTPEDEAFGSAPNPCRGTARFRPPASATSAA